jgi:7-cyano-7-deazaguanine reductase
VAGVSSEMLKTFEVTPVRRNYRIPFEFSEFTSLCPATGQANFGKIIIDYLPDKIGLENKSLETYLQSFHDIQIRREEVVNRILDDLVEACEPRQMIVRVSFSRRDGMNMTIHAAHPPSALKQWSSARTNFA